MGDGTDVHGEVRVLGPSGIEDYHAHLMRLDRMSRFPGTDDHAIDTHCLGLVAAGAILIGIYVDGAMRAGAEIVPDRTARRAEAAITVEPGFHEDAFERRLTERIVEEARRYHLHELSVMTPSRTQAIKVPAMALAG